MKRLVAVLSSLLVLPAFAEVAPEYYYQELMAQYADEMPVTEFVEEEVATEPTETETKDNTPVVPAAVSPRTATGRATTSRAITSATTSSARNVASRNVSNATTARTVSARPSTVSSTTTATRPTTTASRSAVNRTTGTTTTARSTAATTVTNRPATTVRSTGAQSQQNLTTRSSSTNTNNTARASIVQTDTVNTPLYVSSRVGVNSTSNVSTRVPTIRVGSTTTTTNTTESVSSTASIDELAQLTDYCKAQYTACMDNFCNVLDDNQGRCSCSANLSNYAETEDALKQATESLQDVAQQIQYIGLTADEVESLFTQTEAELEMQTTTDNTQLKNSLDKIKDMIVEVQGGSVRTSTSTGLSFDLSGLLDFSIDSTGFDLSSFLGMSSNTGSISNQRGEQLYKTAAARCKASVLNSCSAQGVDINVITNSYDLEIDKACIAYERALTESNDQMASTVRNARSVLQRARLLVAQQKNAYDLRECVSELDNCMQDDFVCGDDYENCLDPTGKYIVNGEIVVGSEPGKPSDTSASIYQMWSYDTDKNAWAEGGTLGEYIESTVTAQLPSQSTTSSISEYLQNKIGYHNDSDGKNYGMCISVLNKCQDITYTGTGQNAKYNPQNNVIKEYLNRTLVQIKAAQDTVLSDYAEDCITDVSSCLAQNNYNTSNAVTINIAINACKSIITTCMSVTGAEDQTAAEWVNGMLNSATCPSGSKGTYPNCLCEGNKAYIPSENACWACPEENGYNASSNKPPACKCTTGYTYDISTNKCVMSKADASDTPVVDDGDLVTP